MQIKFPKSIIITSFYFDVVQDKNYGGGSFSCSESKITIGTKYLKKDPHSVFNVICHEIMEVIMVIQMNRYDDASVSGNHKFFQDHKEFQNNIQLFSQVIQQFIK